MADEGNAPEGSTQGGNSNKLLIIIVIVLLVLVIAIGVGLVFALMGSKDDAKTAVTEGQAVVAESHGDETEVTDAHGDGHGAGVVFPLETFIVNLKMKGSFLKVDLQLVFADASLLEGGGGEGHGGGALDNDIPRIRDVIILILSSKEARDVLSVEGKEQLREEIKTGVNEVLDKDAVSQVLFTEFLVQ